MADGHFTACYPLNVFSQAIENIDVSAQMTANFIKLRRVFVDIDVSNTGMVSFTTFRGVLQQLGATVGLSISTELQCRIWVQLVDRTSGGNGGMLSRQSPFGGNGRGGAANTKGLSASWIDVSNQE